MTDWQQPLVVALTQTTGLSIVHETVYENRLGFTEALQHSGARIQTYRECLGGSPMPVPGANFQHSAVISGPPRSRRRRSPCPTCAAASYVIAALAARGRSRVHGIDIINRGYERFSDKLRPSAPPPSSSDPCDSGSADGLARPDAADPHPGGGAAGLVELDAHRCPTRRWRSPARGRRPGRQDHLDAVVEQRRARSRRPRCGGWWPAAHRER